ncbi:MAG: hypothetical protein NC313_13185 [Butyrivibrio sp.]|nr:hypothetical protein [Butyrivibrio sp.]
MEKILEWGRKGMLPLLLLGRYNVMCIDDYAYGLLVHDTWTVAGSL